MAICYFRPGELNSNFLRHHRGLLDEKTEAILPRLRYLAQKKTRACIEFGPDDLEKTTVCRGFDEMAICYFRPGELNSNFLRHHRGLLDEKTEAILPR